MTLYIVATPIGNLDDMTFRAVNTLQNADLIACEDTRHSGKLLKHFEIKTPMLSVHDHNESSRVPELIDRLKQGENIALISDAGTPLIADPGYKLVAACHDQNITVCPIPGASSTIAALSSSGLPTDKFTFHGFLPPKSVARQKVLQSVKDATETLVFFDSAKRLQNTLKDIQTVMGDERRLCLCREMTKLHEQIKLATVSGHLKDSMPTLGEFVLVIEGSMPKTWTESELKTSLIELLNSHAPSTAAALLAEQSNLPKRQIYQLALNIKKNTAFK